MICAKDSQNRHENERHYIKKTIFIDHFKKNL